MRTNTIVILLGLLILHIAWLGFPNTACGQSEDEAVAAFTQGMKHYQEGRHSEAIAGFEKARRLFGKLSGDDSFDVAACCNALGIVHGEMGQFAKAEPLYRQSLDICEAKVGKNHPATAAALTNLGNLYKDMGQYAKAEPLFRRSLEIYEAKLPRDHQDTAACLNNLAVLYHNMFEWAKAEPLFRRSLNMYEATLGKNHPDTARCLNNLANLYLDMRQYDRAEPMLLRSLAIREANFPKDHQVIGASLNNLGKLYQGMGQYAKGEPLQRRSLEIYEAKLGKDHPTTAMSMKNMAICHAIQKDWSKAIDQLQLSRQATTKYLSGVLAVLSEKEQLALLETKFERDYFMALSMGWSARKEATRASAEWLLNGKAIAHQSLAEQRILARDAKDPNARQLVELLQNTRSSLAAQISRMPKPGTEKDYQQEMQFLKFREQDVAQKLARTVGRAFRANPWVTLDEVQAKLSAKSAFVDIARFGLFDFNTGEGKGWRYVAWITPPQGDVQLIDLGDAEMLDKLVDQTRKELLDSAKSVKKVGEIEGLESLQKPLKELSAKVLHPLLPSIEKYDEWIISPDGALWLTPWNALVLPDGKFAVEKHLIRHVVSGRDLVQDMPKVKAEAALIFADPDYDLNPGKVLALAGIQRKGDEEDIRSVGSAHSIIPRVSRLPATAFEAEAARIKIEQWLGRDPKVFMEGQASETLVKSVKNPRVLVLATHGYFLPTQEVESKDRPGLDFGEGKRAAVLFDKKGQPIENPLLRCGLLLAGCNKRAEAKPGEDDGILTGLEIVGMNLQGCELVVLSACETGLGDVRNGEGVAGLRQAFQLAGAKGVLASLWQVPDRETALLMNAFYGELAKGKSQAEALRQAQLQRIASRRAQFGAAHPFFWAAFTLTNRGVE